MSRSESNGTPTPGPSGQPDEPPAQPEVQHLEVKVVDTQDGRPTVFKIKYTTPMSKVIKAYCVRENKAVDALRFTLHGLRIQPKDTPASLGMDDGDEIQVFVEQQGGGK